MTEHKQNDKASKPIYVSQDGFVTVPLRRGFDAIKPLWDVLQDVGNCFICGGYPRFCASPNKKPVEAGDVDVYCETQEVFDALEARFENIGLAVRHENNMALTYESPEGGIMYYMPSIQLIKPLAEARLISVGTRDQILANFDFTVIRAAIISPTEVKVDADFMHDEEHKLIRIKNIHCPISSTLRCMKYSRKGYFLRPFECLGLFMDWSDRDDDYRVKLINFLEKAKGNDGLSQEEVDELEAMMRID